MGTACTSLALFAGFACGCIYGIEQKVVFGGCYLGYDERVLHWGNCLGNYEV